MAKMIDNEGLTAAIPQEQFTIDGCVVIDLGSRLVRISQKN